SWTSTRAASPILPVATSHVRRRRSRSSGVTRERCHARQPMMASRIASTSASIITANLAMAYGEATTGIGRGLAGGSRLLEYLTPVLQELVEPLIGQRVIEKHVQDFERHGPDVRASRRRIDNVNRRPQGCGQHLRFEAVVLVDMHDLPDQIHPDGTD